MNADMIATFIGNHWSLVDKDNSGFLEKEEIHGILQKFHENHGAGKPFNEEIFEGMWAKLDNTGAGKIDQARLIEAATNFARNNGLIE